MSWELFGKDVATYQERLGSCLTKSFDISKASWKLLEDYVTLKEKTSWKLLEKCYNLSRASWKFLEKSSKVTMLKKN